MEDVLEIQDQTQAPLQEDPPRKKLYKGLVKDKLYSKSYDEFNKQYSTPEAIDRLHKGLVEEKLYSKSINDFNKQYFSDLTPTSKKKVGTIGFEESSLQAGNVLSQSDGVVGEEIPQIEMYTLPNGEMVETDPVSISRKYKELKDRKKTVTEGVGSSFGMGTGTTKEVEDEESQKAAKKLSGDFLGIDIEGIYEDTQGLSDDLVRVYNNDILPDREWNNQLYQRKLANIKWRSSFEKKLLEDVDKGNIDPDNYNRIKHGIEQLPISTGQGDYSNQRAAVKSLAADIREYGGENRDKLLKDFAVEVSKVYGNPDNKAEEKFKDSPESKYLNTDAQLGYQYLQDVSPDKAEQYKRLFIDPKSLKDNPDELRGYNHLMQTLEETGINLKQNAVTEELNSLNKQAKINGGLTPEQIERATKLEKVNEELSAKRNELDSKYPDRIGDKIDDAVQEVMGQRTAGFDYAGGKVFTAFRNTAQGVWEAASSPFMSDESNTLRELAIMGQSLEDEKIYHKTDRNKALQYDTMVIQPELQKEVDLIKNNNLLTDDQKEQKLYKLFRENTDKFGRVPIKNGEFNINPSSILYGMTDLGTSLLPFVAIEAATGGIGGAGAGAKFLRTFTAAASSTFHDEYAAALMEGKSQSEAYRSAMASTAINSLAMAGAGTPTEIRAMASTKTSAGKLIKSMSDDAIESVLKKGTPKGLKAVSQNVKERLKATPKMIKQGVKTGAKFEAYMSAANAINGREQDFKRSLLAIGEFGILGAALGQAAFKTPTQLQKSAGLEFGKKPDEYIAIAESMKKDGLLTDAQLEQRTELIKSYGEAYKSLPKNLDEKQQREYLYETVIKNEATKGKSNLPPKQAAEAEHQAMVADYKREIILDQPTENGLESRKSSLEKKLEKKDEEGKLVLDEKEAAKVKAEIEAIDTHLDTTKKEVKEEELPNLSQPIEGVNEKGIPIGENVPPPVDLSKVADQIKEPAYVEVFKSGDKEMIDEALKEVSDQWHDKVSREHTESKFPKEIIDAAKEKYPQESNEGLADKLPVEHPIVSETEGKSDVVVDEGVVDKSALKDEESIRKGIVDLPDDKWDALKSVDGFSTLPEIIAERYFEKDSEGNSKYPELVKAVEQSLSTPKAEPQQSGNDGVVDYEKLSDSDKDKHIKENTGLRSKDDFEKVRNKIKSLIDGGVSKEGVLKEFNEGYFNSIKGNESRINEYYNSTLKKLGIDEGVVVKDKMDAKFYSEEEIKAHSDNLDKQYNDMVEPIYQKYRDMGIPENKILQNKDAYKEIIEATKQNQVEENRLKNHNEQLARKIVNDAVDKQNIPDGIKETIKKFFASDSNSPFNITTKNAKEFFNPKGVERLAETMSIREAQGQGFDYNDMPSNAKAELFNKNLEIAKIITKDIGNKVAKGYEQSLSTKPEQKSVDEGVVDKTDAEKVNQLTKEHGEPESPQNEKERKKIFSNTLLDTDGNFDAAFHKAGYKLKEGIWLHPDGIAEKAFDNLSPETKKVLAKHGVKYILGISKEQAVDEGMTGHASSHNYDGKTAIGMYLYEGGENWAGADHVALHELGHSIFEGLPQETQDLFHDNNPTTNHGNKVKNGDYEGHYQHDTLHKNGNKLIVGEEDFAELFAENKGDLDKTIAAKKEQSLSTQKSKPKVETTKTEEVVSTNLDKESIDYNSILKNVDINEIDNLKRNITAVDMESFLRKLERKNIIKIDC